MSKVAEKTAVRVSAKGDLGTICLIGPCALCGRRFSVQNKQPRLVARSASGGRPGLACFRCASLDADSLKGRLLSEARRLKREAYRLERLVKEGIAVDPAACEAASAALADKKTGL